MFKIQFEIDYPEPGHVEEIKQFARTNFREHVELGHHTFTVSVESDQQLLTLVQFSKDLARWATEDIYYSVSVHRPGFIQEIVFKA